MQDISLLPTVDMEVVLAALRQKPIDEKMMKQKVDRFQAITSYCEQEYLPDVVEGYAWLVAANRHMPLREMLAHEKLVKPFCEEFLKECAKHLILCKKFHLLQLMVVVQQFLLECLVFFRKHLAEIDRVPKMVGLLKTVLEIERQFYRLNAQTEYPHMPVQPTREQASQNLEFVERLKIGDIVDALKSDYYGKRMCWSRARVTKQGYASVYCEFLNDRKSMDRSIDKKCFELAPVGTFTGRDYDWRLGLKVGDAVDYEESTGCWRKAKVEEVRESDEDDGGKYIEVRLDSLQAKEESDFYANEWLPVTSNKIQPAGLITSTEQEGKKTFHHELHFDDYNDLILDPQGLAAHAIVRNDTTKSLIFVELVNRADEMGIFTEILRLIRVSAVPVEVCADLVHVICLFHGVFSRRFAIVYLRDLAEAVVQYLQRLDEANIRNFSKQRCDNILIALHDFYRRLLPAEERRRRLQTIKLELALKFINSDFLERKMHAITTITEFVRLARGNLHQSTFDDVYGWIIRNDLLRKIFNEKSHPELMSRAMEFIKLFLAEQPQLNTLDPFLEINQTMLKVSNELFDSFPRTFREALVAKITSRENVSNKDALDIVKKHGGSEAWLLQNGGEGWVDVVKLKKRRGDDIKEVLKHRFEIVQRVTRQVNASHDGKFRSEFFEMLEANNYLHKVIDMPIPLEDKTEFCEMVIASALELPQSLFDKLVDMWEKEEVEAAQPPPLTFYQLFELVLSKLDREQIRIFFDKFFAGAEQLSQLSEPGFQLFRSCFLRINEGHQFIERKFGYYYADSIATKKERKETTVITVNPNKLVGMAQLMNVVFSNERLEVVQAALEFIAFLFDHLAKNLASSVKEFKENFLQQCLERLYTSTSYEKYLKIIENILNESEKDGNGGLHSLESALPPQKVRLQVVDGFNAVKWRFPFETTSNTTLYELRFAIGKFLQAYVHEMNVLTEQGLLDERLNGLTVQQAHLTGPLTIERKVKIDRAPLLDGNNLSKDATRIFSKIFSQYSTNGLMSKAECQKYHQKCVGEMSMSYGENKVGEIYETYDTDKDGFLTFDDFIKFYEKSIRARESTVWSNLEAMKVRNDLKILDDLEITHVDPQTLIRTLLLSDQKFMGLLFKILHHPEENNRRAAWKLLQRLPLCETANLQNFDLKNPYALRYWLYIVDRKQNYALITHSLLEQILSADKETLAIGLQVASHVKGLDLPIFKQLIGKLREVNSRESLDFYEKIILDYSLKLIVSCLASSPEVSSEYTTNHRQYEQLFLSGLMSSNMEVRIEYCEACRKILATSLDNNFALFEIIFRMVYTNFESCNKESLYTEYFELFSELLEMLRKHPSVLERLQLNWLILTRSIIDLFRSHKCTEERLSSPVDWVVQGFMRILSKLLNEDTLHNFVELVPYLFQNLLFPEGGRNKLKTAATRKEAYELIYNICASKPREATEGPTALELLFQSGFKRIYKTMSQQKVQTYSYYYNTYNEIRSELGYAGIRNLGCICYMIAMIQQFYMTRPFRYLLLMADDKQPECLTKRGLKEIDDNILHQFQSMFAHLELTERQEYNPDEFCFSFKDFEGNPVNVSVQQDAQEFLNMIFDKLEKGVKDTPFRQVLDSVYGGRSCTQLTCSECKAVKERHENFYNLSLEVKGFRNIDESFRKFISGETIADYKCDACGKKCDITKRCLLSSLPNYFVVHLQRICFNYDKFENEKINSRWEFPHQLNVHDYTVQKQQGQKNSEEFEYQLKGIVVHIGSAEYGHYFSYIKVAPQQWLEFNDERVREFDPKDIETECFGGEHWRRENQSAYLLVYEKKVKSKVLLEFESQEEMEQMVRVYGLKNLLQPAQLPEPIAEEQTKEKEEQTEADSSQQGSSQPTDQKPSQEPPQPPPKPKLRMLMDFDKVPYFVPERLVSRINQSNEDFSMNLNVSNNEFAQFVYRILSIDPPKSLRVEYLDLCFECFHLKQNIEGTETPIADWMAKRFRELIVGSGWEFLASIQSWEKDILAMEKSSRISMRNLLISVLSDIIQTYRFSDYADPVKQSEVLPRFMQIPEDTKAKITKVVSLLDSFTELMHTEVPRNWQRFQQYFEVWAELIRSNEWVRTYASGIRLVARLLGFILQDNSPFKFSNTRSVLMGTKYTYPHFQYPLEVLALLVGNDSKLAPDEQKCLSHYNFLESLTKHHPKSARMIDMVCRDNAVNSERMAFLFNYGISKVSHSDDVKPLIEGVHQFVAIDDGMRAARIEWVLGYPQLVYHPNSQSFGIYGMYSLRENVLTYRSAVRYDPVLHMNLIIEKNTHISALLISMLLQLEKDGYISLGDYPPTIVNNEDFTSQFGSFVASYYEESRRSYKGSHYIEYGERLRDLWAARQPKPRRHRNWLIGSTTSSKEERKTVHGPVEITVTDCTVAVVESTHSAGRNESIPEELVQQRMGTLLTDAKIMKKYKNSELFIGKPHTSTYLHNTYNTHEEDVSDVVGPNAFEGAEQLQMIRKITLRNTSSTPQLVVLDLKIGSGNVWPRPASRLSFVVEDYKEEVLVLVKEDPHGEWGTFDYTVEISPTTRVQYNYGQCSSDDYPTYIITKPAQEAAGDQPS